MTPLRRRREILDAHRAYVRRRVSAADDELAHAAGCYDCDWLSVALAYAWAVEQALAHEQRWRYPRLEEER